MNEEPEERIKIAYVINDLKLGGAQKMLLELSSKLDRRAFEIIVYYLNPRREEGGFLGEEFESRSIKVVCVCPDGKKGLLRTAWRLSKLWRKHKPDVVHAHLPYSVIASALALRLVTKVGFIIHEHQSSSHFSWKTRVLRTIARIFSSLTICYSEGVEDELFRETHILTIPPANFTARSCTIRNGVDVETIIEAKTEENRARIRNTYNFGPNDMVILSIARLIPWKGQATLVEAFISLLARYQHVRLLLVGSGPDRESLQKMLDDARVSTQAIIAGDQHNVPEILASADIFSLVYTYPPGKEGDALGVAGFEALSAGLPVLAGKGQTIMEGLQSGVNIMLIEPRNSEELSEALGGLVENPSWRERLGSNAHVFAERNLNWKNIVPIYDRIYTLIKKT